MLEGYINVDLVEDRSGVKPDVNCDLRNLSVFKSDYADEILSVHVVEHFWRWEVEEVLSEVVSTNKKVFKTIDELLSFLHLSDAWTSGDREASGLAWERVGPEPPAAPVYGEAPRELVSARLSTGLARQEGGEITREPVVSSRRLSKGLAGKAAKASGKMHGGGKNHTKLRAVHVG